MTAPAPPTGDHFRGDPDDGRTFTYDPAGAEDGDGSDDPTPWRLDDDRPPRWFAREELPAVLVPLSHDEWLKRVEPS